MRLGFTVTHQNPNGSKTVDRSRLFGTKEDKVESISRKGNDIGVLGSRRYFFINYLENGKRITGEYYSNLLTRLD
jgi:hypothetical protein